MVRESVDTTKIARSEHKGTEDYQDDGTEIEREFERERVSRRERERGSTAANSVKYKSHPLLFSLRLSLETSNVQPPTNRCCQSSDYLRKVNIELH